MSNRFGVVTALLFVIGGLSANGQGVDLEEVIGSIEEIADYDVPLDAEGALTETDRHRFRYELSSGRNTEDKLKALVALWFDGGGENFDSIILAWWSSVSKESALRVLAMAVPNLRGEPTSAKLPFRRWSERFDEPEESLRKSEYGFLSSQAKEIASVLHRIAIRENGGEHLDRLKDRFQAVAKDGMGEL